MEIKDFKIVVTPEQSKIIQEFLFKNGYSWISKVTNIQYTNLEYLFFSNKRGISVGRQQEDFNEKPFTELTFEQFKKLYMQEDKSLRYNEGKPKWSLVDFKSLEPMVRVLEYGCTKYEKDNWKKGLDNTEVLESLSRHLFALMSGEELDPESQLPHIGHIMCNAMFFQYHKNKENGA